MNKLVPGALYSGRAAAEQRIRTGRRFKSSWPNVAQGFRKSDPHHSKLARVVHRMAK